MVIPKIKKSKYRSAYQYHKFVNQMIDKNDYGIYKQHACTKQFINYCLKHGFTSHALKIASKYKTTYKLGKHVGYGAGRYKVESFDDVPTAHPYSPLFEQQFRQWVDTGKVTVTKRRTESIERHITASQHHDRENLIYYTSDASKEFNLLCLDFDYVPAEEIALIISFLNRVFPNSYWERTKKGIHYYIIIQYEPFDVMNLLDDYHYTEKTAIYRNTLTYLLVLALSDHVDHLDRPKGTCGRYDYSGQLIKCGDLCSLPACSDYDEYNRFYGSSTFDEHYVTCIINWLNNMDCRYDDIYSITGIRDAIDTYSEQAGNYTYTVNQKYVDALNGIMFGGAAPEPAVVTEAPAEEPEPVEPTSEVNSEPNTIMVYSNENMVCSIDGNDSQLNELQFISEYIRTHYKEHAVIPTEDDTYRAYLQQTGYSKLDTGRRCRFSNNYTYVVSTFNPELMKDKTYNIGDYIGQVDETDAELTEWVNSNTCFKSNIYQVDVDIAMGYIYTCNLNQKHKRSAAVKRLQKIEGITAEQAHERLNDTCSIKGMRKWFKFKKQEHGEFNGRRLNACNKAKAIAMFELLMHLELITCEDDDYSTGVARKYKLKDVS